MAAHRTVSYPYGFCFQEHAEARSAFGDDRLRRRRRQQSRRQEGRLEASWRRRVEEERLDVAVQNVPRPEVRQRALERRATWLVERLELHPSGTSVEAGHMRPEADRQLDEERQLEGKG